MSWVSFFLAIISLCESSLFQNLIPVSKIQKWLLSLRYSMAIVILVSWSSSSVKILLVHFVNRQLLYHSDELFQPDVLLFGSWWQEKNRLLKGEDDKGWGDRKAKFLQKMKMTRQSFLLLIYFWLNMTERLSWGKELLLTADNIATPYLHTTSTLYK